MSTEVFKLAIVGSGPGGLSAACRAAEMGDSYVLLEAQPHLSNTIYRYQKGKHVMAEPNVLPLRAATGFGAGSRETILSVWQQDAERLSLNVRHRAEVSQIQREPQANPTGMESLFRLTLASGGEVFASSVVLAIGVQGNLRKLESRAVTLNTSNINWMTLKRIKMKPSW